MGKYINRAGQTYTGLTALYVVGKTKNGHIIWRCSCVCGNYISVASHHLQDGTTISCGCFRKERASKLNWLHGLTKHPLFSIWHGIKKRCCCSTDTGFKNYGGRGIAICSEWKKDFIPFYIWAINNGWKKGLTIDRVNNDGNYEPRNCQFIPIEENIVKQRLLKSSNTSGYKGVSFITSEQKYAARIKIKGRDHFLGYYNDPIKAAHIYDALAKTANDGRSINFP